MSKKIDRVDSASIDSFPASDPHVAKKVVEVGGQLIVHVPNCRGEELREHLAAHGFVSKVSKAAETPFERLEIEADGSDIEDVQAIIDQWED